MGWAVDVHALVGGGKLEVKWSKELAVAGDVVLLLFDADGDSSIKDMKRGLLAIVLYECGNAYWPKGDWAGSVCIGTSGGSSSTLSTDGSKVVSEFQSMSVPNPEDFEGV